MWDRIKVWFKRSETLAWARLQVFVGIVWTTLSSADLAPVLDAKYLTYWLIANGIISECLRRRGTETVDGVLLDKK